jgi:tellurite methyltransferase
MGLTYKKEYWKYYRDAPTEPSSFAYFCRGFMKPGNVIIDLGCGNGRDTLYFRSEGMKVTPIDYAEQDIEDFVRIDFDDLIFLPQVDYVYCRFLFHAIPEYMEDMILRMSCGSGLMIEARSDKGVPPDDGHYRRLINAKKLVDRLENVIYMVEQDNLAVYKDENPMIIRIVCRKY